MEFKQISLSQAQKQGLSSIVRSAEADGLTILTKNGTPCAMVIPLSPMAYAKYLRELRELIDTDIKNDTVPEEYKSFAYFLRGLSQMQIDMFDKR